VPFSSGGWTRYPQVHEVHVLRMHFAFWALTADLRVMSFNLPPLTFDLQAVQLRVARRSLVPRSL
jgi:hypothetical protein